MRSVKRGIGLVALCAGLLAVSAGSAAGASHPFLSQLYKFVPAPNTIAHFEGPCGLAVDSNGHRYVSDYYHDDVDVFSSGGGFETKIEEVEPLDGPCGLAVAASGELFVNVFHRNVTRFTPDTFPIEKDTEYGAGTVIDSGNSTGVAIEPATGYVYVNDRTYVAVYEASGAPVEEGSEPLLIGEGALGDAYGVAVSSFPATEGYVYVANAATDTILVFDPATSLEVPVLEIDGAGTPQGGFRTLRDAALAIDQSTGNLLVAHNVQGPFFEHPRAAVAEFNPAGEYRGTVQSPTALWFGEPTGIAVDNSATASAGRVYVTTGNSEMETIGQVEKPEESAVYAFGPSEPGQRLEVTASGAGTGTVSSSPAGIACPPACAAEYDEGAVVTLSATPDEGSVFAAWSGCDSEPGGNCLVTMSAAKAVEAQFEVAPPAALGGEGSTSGGSATQGSTTRSQGSSGDDGAPALASPAPQVGAFAPRSQPPTYYRKRNGHRHGGRGR